MAFPGRPTSELARRRRAAVSPCPSKAAGAGGRHCQPDNGLSSHRVFALCAWPPICHMRPSAPICCPSAGVVLATCISFRTFCVAVCSIPSAAARPAAARRLHQSHARKTSAPRLCPHSTGLCPSISATMLSLSAPAAAPISPPHPMLAASMPLQHTVLRLLRDTN